MKLLHRYVLRELFWPTVGSLMFFTIMMLVARLFRLTDLLLQTDVRGSLLARMLWLIVMSLISFTTPMALLLATLIGFGRLVSENEVLAMRASGVSLWSVFAPVLAVGALISGGLVYMNWTYVPSLFQDLKELEYDIRFDAITNLQPQTFYVDPELSPRDYDISLYYESREDVPHGPNETVLGMREIALQLVTGDSGSEKDNASRRETLVFAREGRIIGDPRTQSITIMLLDGALIPINHDAPEESTTVAFDRMTKVIQSEMSWRKRGGELARSFDGWELLHKIRYEQPEGPVYKSDGTVRGRWKDYFRLINQMVVMVCLPWSALVFIAIGMPLAIAVRRGTKSVSFAITFVLMFFYYMLVSYGQALGEHGNPTGWIMIAVPNVVFGLIGLILMWRSVRR